MAVGFVELSLWVATPERGIAHALLWSGLALQGTWLALAFAGGFVAQGPAAAAMGLGPGRLGIARIAVACVGVILMGSAGHVALSVLALRDSGTLGAIDDSIRAAAGPSRVLAFVAVGLAPGICEEVFFRGTIQHGLARRLPAAAAIVLAALLFGLAHGDLVHGAAAAVLGVYLGVVTWAAGSVRPAIAAHMANNLMGLAAASLPVLRIQPSYAIAAGLAAVALGCLGFVVRGRRP